MAGTFNAIVELLNRCGDFLWQSGSAMFVQVAVLVVILFFVDLCLRKRVRAVVRYWMWMLVPLKLVLPVTLYTPASAAYWLSDYRPAAVVDQRSSKPANDYDIEPTDSDITVATSSIEPTIAEASIERVGDQSPERPEIAQAGEVIPFDNELAATPLKLELPELSLPRASGWLFAGWLLGVSLFGGICVRRSLYVRRLILRAAPASEGLVELLREGSRLMRLKPNVARLRITDDLGSPAICGFIKPTILLPRHLLASLDREQLLLVFVHELAHWKRFDLHANCLQTVLQVVYFYNPLVWLANAKLRRLREESVDETVLVTLNAKPQRYSATLLDIAALMRRPADAAVPMVGVLESRHALAQRIRRIIERQVPRTAKLGVPALTAIVLLGLVVLPMSSKNNSPAVEELAAAESPSAKDAESPVSRGPQPDEKVAQASTEKSEEPTKTAKPVLSGRIADKSGAPVTDAEVRMFIVNGRRRILETRVDNDGRYSFNELDKAGEYMLQVRTTYAVGIERPGECPKVTLSDNTSAVKDITLERACQLQIEAVDETGKPAPRVMVYPMLLTAAQGDSLEGKSTDKDGLAMLSLKPSNDEYLIGTSSREFACGKLVIKLNDPTTIVTRRIVQRAGVEVKGTSVCSDGKPPVGWTLNLLPDWWKFGRYPRGAEIADDGSFTFQHVVPGKYDISVSIPGGRGVGPTILWVLRSQDLSALDKPLALKIDHPSPSSAASISGRVRMTGGEHAGLRIEARSDSTHQSGSGFVPPGASGFHIPSLAPGKYTLKVEDPGFESKDLEVVAPAKNVELEVAVRTKPTLRGIVVRKDTQEPLRKFYVRTIKLRTLRGPKFVGDPKWRDVDDASGKFDVTVLGPGVYRFEAFADGFARALSEEINTDKMGDAPTRLELVPGVALSGNVVDEQGKPIDGAIVVPFSELTARDMGARTEKMSATTLNGKFTLGNVLAGKESLKITHPDYLFAIIKDLQIPAEGKPADVAVTLTRGATVRGRVFDFEGRPSAHLPIVVETMDAYAGHRMGDANDLPQALTDENGDYELRHLPEQACRIHRGDEDNAVGVVRQTIVPENGKTNELNFGVGSKLSGRLLVNGSPLANVRLALLDEQPSSVLFAAYANTGEDGSFAFRGPGIGQRTLYRLDDKRPHWIPVKTFRLTSQDLDAGKIDHRVGKLTVKCPPGDFNTANLQVQLREFEPVWNNGRVVAGSAKRQSPGDPLIFDNVPPGKYELNAFTSPPAPPKMAFRRIDITETELNPTVTWELPHGSASVHGKLELAKLGSYADAFTIRSRDGRLVARIARTATGTYSVDKLPAGGYYLTDTGLRNADPWLEFSLKENEVKSLDLTPATLKEPVKKVGYRVVQVYTSEGMPLLGCDFEVSGPGGKLSPNSRQEGRVSLVGSPGTYNLAVSYPEFQTHRGTVELIGKGSNGRYPEDLQMIVRLARSNE